MFTQDVYTGHLPECCANLSKCALVHRPLCKQVGVASCIELRVGCGCEWARFAVHALVDMKACRDL